MSNHPNQLGFGDLLAEAAETNAARQFDKDTAHLPGTKQEAITYHHQQIKDHHTAMLACDFETDLKIRKDAHLLARKLNGGKPGILAHDNAPGCVLARECAAEAGAIPLWGQDGTFQINTAGCAIQIDMGGMFGICATAMTYLGFEVRAIDRSKPFLSSTGYRSFLGVSVPPEPGMTTADFAQLVVEAYIAQELHGKLVPIEPEYL